VGFGPDDYRTAIEKAAAVACNRVYNRLRGRGVVAAIATELAADAVQTAVVKVYQLPDSPARFQDVRHLANWLALVAYRAALDVLRRKHDTPTSDLDYVPAADEPDEVGWPEDVIQAGLRGLEERDRQFLKWPYYDGLTDKQIGERLYPGEPPSSRNGQRARIERLRALGRLRAVLFALGLDPEYWPGRTGRFRYRPGRDRRREEGEWS
jgi:RNA polymerase sigma factor (sigma-70 family)